MEKVFSYADYRKFMRDFYSEKKNSRSHYSYAVFAEKAGFKTRSNLIEIVNGKRNLPKNSIYNIASAMTLKKKETEYFEALVHFNHAKTVKEKEYYFEKMKSLSGKSAAKIIGMSQYAYFSKWFNPVVRELVTMKSFNGDLKHLAKKVKPVITSKQVKESMELLLKLDLIKKTASGKYRQTDAALNTGDEISSHAVIKYQQENLNLANMALENIRGKYRDISTITAGISEEGFKAMKKELQDSRRRLEKIANEDTGISDRVYQLNLVFFPVSDISANGEKE